MTVFRDTSLRQYHVHPVDWKGGQEHTEDILSAAFVAPNVLATGKFIVVVPNILVGPPWSSRYSL